MKMIDVSKVRVFRGSLFVLLMLFMRIGWASNEHHIRKKSGIVLANRCLKLLCTSGCANIPNTPRCSIGYTPSRVKFQSMPVSKNFKMYKMNSRNRGITAANAILRISCFIFRTVIAIFVQYYGIFDENRKKTDFLFCL